MQTTDLYDLLVSEKMSINLIGDISGKLGLYIVNYRGGLLIFTKLE